MRTRDTVTDTSLKKSLKKKLDKFFGGWYKNRKLEISNLAG